MEDCGHGRWMGGWLLTRRLVNMKMVMKTYESLRESLKDSSQPLQKLEHFQQNCVQLQRKVVCWGNSLRKLGLLDKSRLNLSTFENLQLFQLLTVKFLLKLKMLKSNPNFSTCALLVASIASLGPWTVHCRSSEWS